MTDWAARTPRESTFGRLAMWSAAGLVVFTAHAGALAWALRQPPVQPAENSPPPAIMIELAPAPQATETEQNEIAPDKQSAEAVKSENLEPVKEPTESAEELVAEKVEPQPPEPVEETPQMQAEETPPDPVKDKETPEQVLAQLDDVEVPLPTARPPPPKKTARKVQKKPVEKPEREKPAPRQAAAVQAQAQVERTDRTAAARTVSGLFSSSSSPAQWQSRLMAHLERRKRYPSGSRARGETGIAYVRFRIDMSGNVLSASLARSSGFPELDQEVVDLVRRASPVPTPPPGVNLNITAPVRFSVH